MIPENIPESISHSPTEIVHDPKKESVVAKATRIANANIAAINLEGSKTQARVSSSLFGSTNNNQTESKLKSIINSVIAFYKQKTGKKSNVEKQSPNETTSSKETSTDTDLPEVASLKTYLDRYQNRDKPEDLQHLLGLCKSAVAHLAKLQGEYKDNAGQEPKARVELTEDEEFYIKMGWEKPDTFKEEDHNQIISNNQDKVLALTNDIITLCLNKNAKLADTEQIPKFKDSMKQIQTALASLNVGKDSEAKSKNNNILNEIQSNFLQFQRNLDKSRDITSPSFNPTTARSSEKNSYTADEHLQDLDNAVSHQEAVKQKLEKSNERISKGDDEEMMRRIDEHLAEAAENEKINAGPIDINGEFDKLIALMDETTKEQRDNK